MLYIVITAQLFLKFTLTYKLHWDQRCLKRSLSAALSLRLTDNIWSRPGVSTHMLTNWINHHLVSVTNGWGQRSMTNGFTRYHRWRPHVWIKSGCISVCFTAVSRHQFPCKGSVICRPCASHDAQICVTPSHRHTDEVIYMGLKDSSEGLAVELTFRSLGALLSIFVTRSDTRMVLLPFTAFCVAEVREVEVSHCCWISVFSNKGACLWSQKMKE